MRRLRSCSRSCKALVASCVLSELVLSLTLMLRTLALNILWSPLHVHSNSLISNSFIAVCLILVP